jgi:hypothetical protein
MVECIILEERCFIFPVESVKLPDRCDICLVKYGFVLVESVLRSERYDICLVEWNLNW